MGDETLGNEAARLMGKYKDHMDKENGKRMFGIKRWVNVNNTGDSAEKSNPGMNDVTGDS